MAKRWVTEEEFLQMKNGGTIHIKPENKGKFNALKKRTGKSTEELTHSKNPLTRKRAIFAQNAAKWHHAEDGTQVQDQVTQIIQAYAQKAKVDPQEIMKQLQAMNPKNQQQAIQQMAQELQGEQMAQDGINVNPYSSIENSRERDSLTSYNQDVKSTFNWDNVNGNLINPDLIKEKLLQTEMLSKDYFLNKTPKGYFNVYDKDNKSVGYSLDGKTLLKGEPMKMGGFIKAYNGFDTFNPGNRVENFKFGQLSGYTGIDLNKTTQYGQGPGGIGIDFNNIKNGKQGGIGITNVNLENGNPEQEVGIKGTGIGDEGNPSKKLKVNPLDIIGSAGDAVIQGGGAIASLAGDESAARALQKAGQIGKIGESIGNVVPIPGAGKALGALTSIFAAPFTAWGEHIATVEKKKAMDYADFNERNKGVSSQNNYGNELAEFGKRVQEFNPKYQGIIDSIYQDFENYNKK